MVNRIFSLFGWLGTALVFVAFAIRFGYPAKEEWAYYLAWAGLVCVLAYTLAQWREIGKMFSRRQARYGTLAATSVRIEAPPAQPPLMQLVEVPLAPVRSGET